MTLGALGQDDGPSGLRARRAARIASEQDEADLTAAQYEKSFFRVWIREYLDRGNLHPNWYPLVPREQMPSYENFVAARTWDYRSHGVPYQPNTTDNTAAYVYFKNYFGSYARGFDIFKVAPVIAAVALTAGAASGALAPYTVAEAGAIAAAETGAIATGASAWEAASLEAAAWEAASAETLTSWAAASAEVAAAEATTIGALTEAEFAEIALESEAAIEGSTVVSEIGAATAPAALPPTSGTGITLPPAQTLVKQALPLALKALTKPSGPTVPPRQAAPVPYAVGFGSGAPQYDAFGRLISAPQYDIYGRELTSAGDNTMLYVFGGLALAVLAAVTLDAQRKG